VEGELIVIEDAASAILLPAPIPPDWIIAGRPEARNKTLAITQDRTSSIMAWECTAGRFEWHFDKDETLIVISGEIFVTMESGEEKRLGLGDVGFFPGGCSCTARIDDHVRKIAVLRTDLPLPLSIGARAWHRLLLMAGLRGQKSSCPPFAPQSSNATPDG
jgi:uncharacterized protein